MKANSDIREYIRRSGIKSYEVAQVLGLDAPSFSRKLQNELSSYDKGEIKKIVDQLSRNQFYNKKSVFNFKSENEENNNDKINILKVAAEIRRLAFRGETKEDYIQLRELTSKMVSLL